MKFSLCSLIWTELWWQPAPLSILFPSPPSFPPTFQQIGKNSKSNGLVGIYLTKTWQTWSKEHQVMIHSGGPWSSSSHPPSAEPRLGFAEPWTKRIHGDQSVPADAPQEGARQWCHSAFRSLTNQTSKAVIKSQPLHNLGPPGNNHSSAG